MKIYLQHLVGKPVRDINGKSAGRIESVMAEMIGRECLVHEYILGPVAWLERLGITTRTLFGMARRKEPPRVSWKQMDITNPKEPRLLISVEELERSTRG